MEEKKDQITVRDLIVKGNPVASLQKLLKYYNEHKPLTSHQGRELNQLILNITQEILGNQEDEEDVAEIPSGNGTLYYTTKYVTAPTEAFFLGSSAGISFLTFAGVTKITGGLWAIPAATSLISIGIYCVFDRVFLDKSRGLNTELEGHEVESCSKLQNAAKKMYKQRPDLHPLCDQLTDYTQERLTNTETKYKKTKAKRKICGWLLTGICASISTGGALLAVHATFAALCVATGPAGWIVGGLAALGAFFCYLKMEGKNMQNYVAKKTSCSPDAIDKLQQKQQDLEMTKTYKKQLRQQAEQHKKEKEEMERRHQAELKKQLEHHLPKHETKEDAKDKNKKETPRTTRKPPDISWERSLFSTSRKCYTHNRQHQRRSSLPAVNSKKRTSIA